MLMASCRTETETTVEWRKLDYSTTVARRRLSACVRAHGGHFEHILWCFHHHHHHHHHRHV